MMEESHIFFHCDPRGDLAGRVSLLCSSVQAEPSLWGGLLAALLYMGGRLLTEDNMTLELLLQRCSFWFTCLPPPVPFHSFHLCSSSPDVPKWTAEWMVSLDTLKRHKRSTINKIAICKLDTSLGTANPLGRQAQQFRKGSNQKPKVLNIEILTSCRMVRAAWQNRNKEYHGLSLITSGIPGLQVHKKGNRRTSNDACNLSKKNDKLFLKEYHHK